jgi:polyketide synthase PksN
VYQGEVKREKETLSVFAADEDLAAAIEAWVAKGKYGKLLELWVKGLSVDWKRLYGERRPRRIPLPTYPFARERYWVPEGSSELEQPSAIPAEEQHGVFVKLEQMLSDALNGTTDVENIANAALRILDET